MVSPELQTSEEVDARVDRTEQVPQVEIVLHHRLSSWTEQRTLRFVSQRWTSDHCDGQGAGRKCRLIWSVTRPPSTRFSCGIVAGFPDSPRPDLKDVLFRVGELGIRMEMIMGDPVVTARF